MVEVSFVDLVFGTVLIAFDGRVLERFVPHLDSTYRIHSTHLRVNVQQPDRRGNWRVVFGHNDGSRGGFDTLTDAAGYAAIHPLLTALAAADVPLQG
jgi:hypothetical protein